MSLFLIITAALLSSTCCAPTDLETLHSNEVDSTTSVIADDEKSNDSEGSESSPSINLNNEYWITTTPLPPIVILPQTDKEILCNFVGSFQRTRMEMFAVVVGANFEFIFNAEKYFADEFREIMASSANVTYSQEFFGIDEDEAHMIIQNKTALAAIDNIVKAHILKMYSKIFQGMTIIHDELLLNAKKVNINLSKETVESEQEMLASFKNLKSPQDNPNYHNDLPDLLNRLEQRFNHKHQCPKKQ